VARPGGRDRRRFRVFVVVSRQVLLDSRFATAICAPVSSARHGLATQVPVGPEVGLKHDSSIHCDEFVSLPKSMLTALVGALPAADLEALDRALAAALEIDPRHLDG